MAGGLVDFFVETKNIVSLARERAIFFCSKQTSEEGDLLFLVRIKPEQVEKRVSWILRANLPAGWLGIESVEIWQRQGGDEEMWKLFGPIKKLAFCLVIIVTIGSTHKRQLCLIFLLYFPLLSLSFSFCGVLYCLSIAKI